MDERNDITTGGGGGGKGGVTFNVQIREVLKRTIVNSSN